MSGSSSLPQHSMLSQVLDWARQEERIRALVLTGSLARGDGSTDQWSDLDAQIIARDYASYIADDSWLDGLGEVWIRFPLSQDLPYKLVWFAGGAKVDFQFLRVDAIHEMICSGALSDEYLRGYIVALDKDGLFRDLPPSPQVFPGPDSPSAGQVEAVINEFYFEAIHVAQFIRRREFWVVKFRDWTMKCDLLQMLEWHARATSDAPVNTWLLGKRIREWTGGETYAAIEEIWSAWDVAALWRGLLRQIKLFRSISRELGDALGYNLDSSAHEQIEAYIRALHASDDLN
ncbi:MAG: aminoglycoside 6-adenylyltransferase [Chloroflexota bacterium]|nr:aminoglycoside 6-adenylyltransferase [Chloroflexota bacterium]